MMPELDGISALRMLKQDPETRLIPVVLMTALNAVEDRVRGIEAGADDFLTKPVDERELLARTGPRSSSARSTRRWGAPEHERGPRALRTAGARGGGSGGRMALPGRDPARGRCRVRGAAPAARSRGADRRLRWNLERGRRAPRGCVRGPGPAQPFARRPRGRARDRRGFSDRPRDRRSAVRVRERRGGGGACARRLGAGDARRRDAVGVRCGGDRGRGRGELGRCGAEVRSRDGGRGRGRRP